jgi:phosphate-selective porin OprO/OprP
MTKAGFFVFIPLALLAHGAFAGEFKPEYKFSDTSKVSLSARLTADYYNLENNYSTGVDTKFKNTSPIRATVILSGQITSKWLFKAEAWMTDGDVTWDDAYIEYSPDKNTSVFIGSNYQTSAIDGGTSSQVQTFAQKALISSAFSQSSRSIGIAVRKTGTNWQWVSGFYGGSMSLPMDRLFSQSNFVQTRYSIAPINGKTKTVHLGASFRYRTREDDALYSYSARPIQMNYESTLLKTGSIGKSDANIGIEAAISNGPYWIILDAQHNSVKTNYTTIGFKGAVIEAAYVLSGEHRPYNIKGGNFGAIKPKKSIYEGGLGSLALTGRYDYLDLQDNGLGGTEKGYTIGLNWYLAQKTIIRFNYAHSDFDFAAPASRDIKSNIYNMRLQIGF